MSELISGKEAFDAAFNGVSAQWRWANKDEDWRELKAETAFSINELKGDVCEFRLKPRTITLNVEIEKPKEVVLCAITGAVGLVYGDLDKAKSVQEALREVFK